MKKLIVLVLAVVLMAGMALPVSAAVYMPDEASKLQTLIATGRTLVPAAFSNYYAVTIPADPLSQHFIVFSKKS